MENYFKKIETIFFYLLLFFLPTQFGKHFWPDFSIVSGIRVDYLSPTLYFTDLLVGGLFITWLISKTKSVNSKTQNNKVRFSFFVAIIVYLIFNSSISQNIFNSFYHLVKFLEFAFVGYYVVTTVRDITKLQTVAVILAFAVLFQSLLAGVQFFNQGSIGSLFYFFGERMFSASTPGIANASIQGELVLRPYGTLPHPNVLAGFLLTGMILLFWMFGVVQEKWKKILYSLSLLFGTGALLLTMSRIAVLLWIFFLLTIFIKVSIQSTKSKYMLLAGFILILGCLFFTPVGNRIIGTNLNEESVVHRQALISSSITLFQKQPLVGVGFGNFLPALAIAQKPLSLGLYLQPVHNIYLLVLAETGIIGVSFFLWFLYSTYRRLLRKKSSILPYLSLLTAAVLIGLFDHYLLTLQQGQLLFALILGLCWSPTHDF